MSVPHELNAAERTWSTAAAPAREQFGLWEQAVREAFVPMAIHAADEGPDGFVSGVEVQRLGGVDVADIVSAPQSAKRTADEARRTPGNVFFLNLPLTDGATVRQEGRTAHLASGDFVVVDGDRPFELDFTNPFRQVSLTLPREVLTERLVAPEEVIGTRVAGGSGVGAVAGAAIRAATTAGRLDARSAQALGTHLADLVALALGGVRPQSGSIPDHLLWRAVLDAADRRIADPRLAPAAVADHTGISVRQLHRMFADHGTTFGRWLLTRRLERASADLRDPARAQWSISRLAHENGFADPSYFARAFKARYDATPREIRRTQNGR